MRFLYGKQDMPTLARAEENLFLLTNGLGGYASLTAAFSVNRCDQGVLVAAVKAPNERIGMVHRVSETLQVGERRVFLSTQSFADGTAAEDGYRRLSSFSVDALPCWTYDVDGVRVTRRCVMAWEKNAAALVYTVENRSPGPCTLRLRPFCKFAPKEEPIRAKKTFTYQGGRITCGGSTLCVTTDARMRGIPTVWETLAYPEDEKDGRPPRGMAAACCEAEHTVATGDRVELEMVFSMETDRFSAREMMAQHAARLAALEEKLSFSDPVARQLALSADAYIARRDSTGGKTILAGYPLFSDWGRDTMIALTGCTLATGRYDDARSILRTFFAYERDGLVPNLFPEGAQQPMYNTVDAALLLINCVWEYVTRTGDEAFIAEAYPVMERIVSAYQKGTKHAIAMDTDGLIRAGDGLDQVTWMDVCVQGILPTPRHGKPVEINAYWYSALRIMARFAEKTGRSGKDYDRLADKVRDAFVNKFYMKDKGYLRDVVSGTAADEQLRCNQIWAVSMPFTMLDPEQERAVVDAVFRHLYTPCGLRTLSPEDPEYHGAYGGYQVKRDMAYHQGTTWVFPMGGYYLAYLKTRGNSAEAARYVREQLAAVEPMLRQGCAGQLPEIYDGDHPSEGKGCFAQAWSVGELLRVFEAVERIEKK